VLDLEGCVKWGPGEANFVRRGRRAKSSEAAARDHQARGGRGRLAARRMPDKNAKESQRRGMAGGGMRMTFAGLDVRVAVMHEPANDGIRDCGF
jgi:hypothetical protein